MRSRSLRSLFLLAFAGSLVSGARALPSFTSETGVRLTSGTPQAVLPLSTSTWRLYFIRDYEVRTASSSNQVDWAVDDTVALSSRTVSVRGTTAPITGCSVLPLSAGGYRMLYSVGVGTGPFGIFIATSADGLSFGFPTVSSAIFVSTGANFTAGPRLLDLSNFNWRLYYSQDAVAGSSIHSVYSSLSSDEGLTWSTAAAISSGQQGEIAVATRTDSRVRIYFTSPVDTSTTTRSTLLSAIAASGVANNFIPESGIRFSTAVTDGALGNPVVIRSSGTEDFRYRLLYNFEPSLSTSPAAVYSAVTSSPDPQSVSPTSGSNLGPATTFQISGEIFSSSPTVKLSHAGQADIVGTSVSRVSDQVISVQFDTTGAALGAWDVVITNSDGIVGTLTAGFTVTFPSGAVALTDNLIRPRDHIPATIAVTTFNDGDLTIKIYTIDGLLVRTLFDQFAPTGTTNVTWDATNDQGNGVASGVYLVKFDGQKLKEIKKIVVIR